MGPGALAFPTRPHLSWAYFAGIGGTGGDVSVAIMPLTAGGRGEEELSELWDVAGPCPDFLRLVREPLLLNERADTFSLSLLGQGAPCSVNLASILVNGNARCCAKVPGDMSSS